MSSGSNSIVSIGNSSSLHHNSANSNINGFAAAGGGAIHTGGGTVIIRDSLLSWNSANAKQALNGRASGGAVYSLGSSFTSMYNSILSDNSVDAVGSGLGVSLGGAVATTTGSILLLNMIKVSGNSVESGGSGGGGGLFQSSEQSRTTIIQRTGFPFANNVVSIASAFALEGGQVDVKCAAGLIPQSETVVFTPELGTWLQLVLQNNLEISDHLQATSSKGLSWCVPPVRTHISAEVVTEIVLGVATAILVPLAFMSLRKALQLDALRRRTNANEVKANYGIRLVTVHRARQVITGTIARQCSIDSKPALVAYACDSGGADELPSVLQVFVKATQPAIWKPYEDIPSGEEFTFAAACPPPPKLTPATAASHSPCAASRWRS